MFISFVVPVYNTEKYLAECLDSLLRQDIESSAYEIICINDGSSDGSLGVLMRYEQKSKNIRIISIPNGGVSAARNMGIETARGEYLWMVDSDDMIAFDILGELRDKVRACRPDIVDFGSWSFQEQLSREERETIEKGVVLPVSFANHVYVTRSVFRREFLLANNIRFQTDLYYSEDSVFQCECYAHAPSRTRIDKAWYFFRYRAGSSVTLDTRVALGRKLESWHRAVQEFRRFYDVMTPEEKHIPADLLMSNLWSLLFAASNLPIKEAIRFCRLLRGESLFPFERPAECTLEQSYQTNRRGIVGHVFEMLYLNLHTCGGFCGMVLWNRAANGWKAMKRLLGGTASKMNK